MPFRENVGSSHVATGTIGLNLRPPSGPDLGCWLGIGQSGRTPSGNAGASTRSPLNVEISAKIPLRDFLVSADVPTGLDCAGLCWTGPLALMGIMCSGLRVEATPLTVPTRLHSLPPRITATHAGVVLMMETKGHARGARRVEGTGITDLRPLADSLDTYARQIHSIAEIIRSIEEESAEQSTEAKAAENTAPCSLHDGQQHLTSTPVISDTLDRAPVIEAHASPVVDPIGPEAIWQRILGARKATEARAIDRMPDKVYQDGCAAVGGGELGFEDQRVASVAALDPNFRLPFNSRRGDLPQDLIAIGSAEEKPGQNAQPLVDLADKGDGPESAQHGLRDADMDLAALRLSSGGWRIFPSTDELKTYVGVLTGDAPRQSNARLLALVLAILAVWLSPTPEQIQAARNGRGEQGTQQSTPAGGAQPSLLGLYSEYEQSMSTPAFEQSAAARASEQSSSTSTPEQSTSMPAPEQSTSMPAPEQPRGWIAEVKKSRPICESADDYVQFQRMALRPSRKAMRRAVEFVKRKCPIIMFEPGNHASVERTET